MIEVTQRPEREMIGTDPPLVSQYNCSHLPLIYRLQYLTAPIQSAEVASGSGNVRLQLPGESTMPLLYNRFAVGDMVYINTTLLVGVYEILVVDLAFPYPYSLYIEIDVPYAASMTGFVYNPNVPNYHLEVNVNGLNNATTLYEVWATVNLFPNNEGLMIFDVHEFINKYIVHYNDLLTVRNELNANVGSQFYLSWTEKWTGSTEVIEVDEGVSTPNYSYFVSAVKQLGESYGNNLAEYVLFDPTGIFYETLLVAKFLSDFNTPTYFRGYPFELAFIMSLSVVSITMHFIQDTINLNGDIISTNSDDISVVDGVGVHRLALIGQLAGETGILYDEGDVADDALPIYADVRITDDDSNDLTETKRVKIQSTCLGKPFLRWAGTKGNWNFWQFNKQHTVTTKSNVIIERGVWNEDVEDATATTEVIKRSKIKSMTLFSRIVTDDFSGLQTLEESAAVQLWQPDTSTWLTVIVDEKGVKYKSSQSFIDIEVTIMLPQRNTIG